MSYISLETKRKIRLAKAQDIELEDGAVKLKFAAVNGLKGMGLGSNMTTEQKADLLLGSLIKPNGDALFSTRKEVEDLLEVLSLGEAMRLMAAVAKASTPEKKTDSGAEPTEPASDASPSESPAS